MRSDATRLLSDCQTTVSGLLSGLAEVLFRPNELLRQEQYLLRGKRVYHSRMRNFFLTFCLIGVGTTLAAPAAKRALLRSVEVKRPDIIMRGAYLGRVEVWAVPTGTGITPDEYTLVGRATRKTPAGRNETWLFPIDCASTSLLATEVFVKAFDQTGKNVGTKSLPYSGATEINDALCDGQIRIRQSPLTLNHSTTTEISGCVGFTRTGSSALVGSWPAYSSAELCNMNAFLYTPE